MLQFCNTGPRAGRCAWKTLASLGQSPLVLLPQPSPTIPERLRLKAAQACGKHVEVHVPSGADHQHHRAVSQTAVGDGKQHRRTLRFQLEGHVAAALPGEGQPARRFPLEDLALHAVLGAEAVRMGAGRQFRYTTGKNATDSALIIDAMDLLHTKSLGGFCIVSSDSDYTRLATRIREAGASVYGFGERKTPQPFVAACDRFIYTEVLRAPNAASSTRAAHDPALEPLLRAAIGAAAKDSGWSALSTVGSLLNKNDPSFDPRNFGFQKLGELVRAQRYVEVKETPSGDGSTNVHLYVRLGGRDQSKGV